MRSFFALIFAVATASSTAACTADVGNCELDPTVDCFKGKNDGGSTGSTSSAGGGGSSTGPACVPSDCPGDDCNAGVCVNDACAKEPKSSSTDCGDGLKCDGMGSCKCTGDNEASCPSDQCNEPRCKGGLCMKEPTPGAACEQPAGVAGKCDDMGLCATCSDGVKNGGEVEVDCGGTSGCGNCDGAVCGDNANCHSGFCTDGVCCNVACGGQCQACTNAITGQPDGLCSAITIGMNDAAFSNCDTKGGCGLNGLCRCEDGELSTGETDVDCGGACGQNCTDGQICAIGTDCAGGNPCVDGVCCASACNFECGSCNLKGTEGLCALVPPPDNDVCPANKECSLTSTCLAAVSQGCNNNGQCATGRCNNNLCEKCAGGNCSGGGKCIDGYCGPASDKGDPCVDGAMCSTGFCVDGVCCESKCDGECMGCETHYTNKNSGDCRPMLVGYDPQNECDGPGKMATCSGNDDGNNTSSCGIN